MTGGVYIPKSVEYPRFKRAAWGDTARRVKEHGRIRDGKKDARARGRAFHSVVSNYSKAVIRNRRIRRADPERRITLPPPPKNENFRRWLFTLINFIDKKGYRVMCVETPIFFLDGQGKKCKLIPDMVLEHKENVKGGRDNKHAVMELKTGYSSIFSSNFAKGVAEMYALQTRDREAHIDQVLGYIKVLNAPHHTGKPSGWKDFRPSRLNVERGFIYYASSGRVVNVDDNVREIRLADLQPAPPTNLQRMCARAISRADGLPPAPVGAPAASGTNGRGRGRGRDDGPADGLKNLRLNDEDEEEVDEDEDGDE